MKRWENGTEIIRRLAENKEKAYLTGGAVRDHLLGKEPEDIDIASTADITRLRALFGRAVHVGRKKETILVFPFGEPVEITRMRGTTIEEDLSSRDFRCNAMAVGPEGELIDPFQGRLSLDRQLVAPVVSAEKTFREDPVRLIRALRMAVQLHFELDSEIKSSYGQLAGLINKTAGERIYQELNKIGRQQIYGEEWEVIYPMLRMLPLGIMEDSRLYRGLVNEAPLFTGKQWWAVLLYRSTAGWSRQALPKSLLNHVKKTSQFLERDSWSSLELYRAGREVLESASLIKFLLKEFPSEDLLVRYDNLPVHSVKDLKVNGKDLNFLDSRKIGDALAFLVEAVISGKVDNDRENLMTYIKGEYCDEK